MTTLKEKNAGEIKTSTLRNMARNSSEVIELNKKVQRLKQPTS